MEIPDTETRIRRMRRVWDLYTNDFLPWYHVGCCVVRSQEDVDKGIFSLVANNLLQCTTIHTLEHIPPINTDFPDVALRTNDAYSYISAMTTQACQLLPGDKKDVMYITLFKSSYGGEWFDGEPPMEMQFVGLRYRGMSIVFQGPGIRGHTESSRRDLFKHLLMRALEQLAIAIIQRDNPPGIRTWLRRVWRQSKCSKPYQLTYNV
jgi:hypothetical protein